MHTQEVLETKPGQPEISHDCDKVELSDELSDAFSKEFSIEFSVEFAVSFSQDEFVP